MLPRFSASWAAAAAVPQTYWGALFASILGFHAWTVNLSTMIASVIGLALVYFAALGLRLRETTAAWVAIS